MICRQVGLHGARTKTLDLPNQPRRMHAVIFMLVCFVALAPYFAHAQSITGLTDTNRTENSSEENVTEIDGTQILKVYDQWIKKIEKIDDEISTLSRESDNDAARVEALIEQLRALTEEAKQVAADAQSQLAMPKSALAAIGSPPESGEPPEADIVANERERHQQTLARHQAELTFVRLIKARVEIATGALASYGQERLSDWVLARQDLSKLVSNPLTAGDVGSLFKDFRPEFSNLRTAHLGAWLLVLAAFIALTALIVAFWLIRKVPRFSDAGEWEDTYNQRELALIRSSAALGYGALPAVACGAFATIAIYLAPDLGRWLGLVASLLLGLAVYIWLFKIIEVALEPTNQQARFLRGSDSEAHKISKLLQGLCILSAVFTTGYVLFKMTADTDAEMLLALKLATVATFSAYAFFVAGQKVFGDAEPDLMRRLYYAIRIGAASVGALAVIMALLGYVNLAIFGSVNVAASILILVATYFMRPILHDGIRAVASKEAQAFEEAKSGLFEAIIHFILDLGMLIMFSVLLLTLWGVSLEGLWLWVKQSVNVLTFGDFRVELIDLAAAALSFVIALFILKIFVRLLRDQILDRINMDLGVRNSISTLLRYISVLLALVVAFVVLGFDVTSLALVFGALLFGIGFGLQNVVDNLISGLIILFQRPIKPGDWINVGEYQGLVQKTGLLSTEIKTFDDASVVVPNSDVITTAVMNRTHGQMRGRVDVPVGVAYGSDVATILQILRDCATANEHVLEDPEPTVVLQDFSDSSLDFELRAYIPDIRNVFETASELRIDVLRRFKDEGVEIPFPQRDIWLKNSDKEAVAITKEGGIEEEAY